MGDTMTKKDELSQRLQSMRPLEGVLPTRRVEVEEPEVLREIARSVDEGALEQAERSADERLLTSLEEGVVERGAMAELAAQEDLREQIKGFAVAGFAFFRATDDYLGRPLGERRAAGGNGTVTRVLLTESQLLLETPRLVVRFAEGTSEDKMNDAIERYGLLHLRTPAFAPGLVQVAAEDGNSLELCLELMAEDIIDYAEPDFIEFVGQRHRPSDPDYGRQWHLNNTGSDGGTVDADISAEDAWDTVRGVNAHTTHSDPRPAH